MTTRPISFSAAMVRALREGRKTQTRRIVSPRTCEFGSIPAGRLTRLYWDHADWTGAWPDGFPDPATGGRITRGYLHVPCHDRSDVDGPETCDVCVERGWATTSHRLYPRVERGDRLWVREAHALLWPDEYPPARDEDHDVEYRADTDGRCLPGGWPDEERGHPDCPRWRPSIHMPRWASRITLKVTDVRIERLNDISEEDAKAEGCEATTCANVLAPKDGFPSFRSTFAILWQSIHGHGSWEANPWVVALSFDAILKNVGEAAP